MLFVIQILLLHYCRDITKAEAILSLVYILYFFFVSNEYMNYFMITLHYARLSLPITFSSSSDYADRNTPFKSMHIGIFAFSSCHFTIKMSCQNRSKRQRNNFYLQTDFLQDYYYYLPLLLKRFIWQVTYCFKFKCFCVNAYYADDELFTMFMSRLKI